MQAQTSQLVSNQHDCMQLYQEVVCPPWHSITHQMYAAFSSLHCATFYDMYLGVPMHVHLAACTDCFCWVLSRLSCFAKLRFISRNDNESLFIAEIQHFSRAAQGSCVPLRLAVCKLYPARYGRDDMTATFKADEHAPEIRVVDISELYTKLVTAVDGGKLCSMVYSNTSGLA